jgi:alpha-methylacyl-CoA racemase
LEEGLRDDSIDPEATKAAVAERIGLLPADYWRECFEGEDDVCCTVVRGVREALEDEHYRFRGVFDRSVEDGNGMEIPALPLPVVSKFCRPELKLGYPALGGANVSVGEEIG